MKRCKATVTLNRPAHEAFEFTINPENTPKWIDGIVEELSNESPTKLGTIYKNRAKDGSWREFEITGYEPGTMFAMSEKDSAINIKYTFSPLNDKQCELEYYVWIDSGNLPEVFSENNLQNILQRLKNTLEVTS